MKRAIIIISTLTLCVAITISLIMFNTSNDKYKDRKELLKATIMELYKQYKHVNIDGVEHSNNVFVSKKNVTPVYSIEIPGVKVKILSESEMKNPDYANNLRIYFDSIEVQNTKATIKLGCMLGEITIKYVKKSGEWFQEDFKNVIVE